MLDQPVRHRQRRQPVLVGTAQNAQHVVLLLSQVFITKQPSLQPPHMAMVRISATSTSSSIAANGLLSLISAVMREDAYQYIKS